jgi:ribosomal protein S18 acetylase RimI-like enzyme
MKIRKATIQDAEKLAELYYEFYSAHEDMGKFWLPHWASKEAKNFKDALKNKNSRKYLLKESIESIKTKGNLLFIAEEDGEILGHVAFSILKNISWFKVRKYGFIDEVCVFKKFRGKGVAKKLMDFAENYLKKEGIRYAILKTSLENKISQEAWENLGYKKELYIQVKELK